MDSVLRIMNQDPPSCAHDPRSSDSKSSSDGGIRGGPGGVDEICGFKILDVQNLPIGGDGPHLGPESSIVVVKVEPEPTANGSPSQGETDQVEERCLYDHSLPTSNTIHVKEELSEDSCNANESTVNGERCSKWSSFCNNVTLKQSQTEKHHQGSPQHKTDCNYPTFICKSEFDQHVGNNLNEGPFKCTVCEKAFKGLTDLKAHETIHTREGQYTCSVCAKSFQYFSYMKEHERLHSGQRPHMCSVCGKSFNTSSSLKRHENVHTGKHTCSVCKKALSTLSYMIRHEKMHVGKYTCSVCRKDFSTVSCMKMHERMHTDKPTCSVCQKSFTTLSYMKMHEKMHMGKNTCSVCMKAFSTLSYMKKHERSHMTHKCSVHERACATSSYLKRPEMIYTGKKTLHVFSS